MKHLLILRHAKSSWDDPGLDDHDRPLNRRGARDAPRMGRLLVREGLVPELVLSSTAIRAGTTARLAVEATERDVPVRLEPTLYLGAPQDYLRLLRALPEPCSRVMLVGHNPGLEDLLAALTGVSERMPTAALASVGLATRRWPDLADTAIHELRDLWTPKKLRDD